MTPTPEPLTDERLAAIEARCQAARTPAPDCACGSFALQYDGCRCERARWESRRCNAEAAALADVPDLVAEVQRLLALVDAGESAAWTRGYYAGRLAGWDLANTGTPRSAILTGEDAEGEVDA